MRGTNPDITLTMPLDDLNKALGLLGTHPFNDVADLIFDWRNQTSQQIQQLQQRQQQAAQGEPLPQRTNGELRNAA